MNLKPIIQLARDNFYQNELTSLREEKDLLEGELMRLQTSTEIRRVKLLEGEVKKLRGLLNRVNKKVKDLEEERKELKELIDNRP